MIGRNGREGSKAQPRHCVSSVGSDGAVHGPPLGGRGPIETSTAKLVDWHEPFVPLRRKVLDLLEIQDRGFTLADDCCPLAFLG